MGSYVSVDAQNNIYFSGICSGSCVLNSQPMDISTQVGTSTNLATSDTPSQDVEVIKINPMGFVQWFTLFSDQNNDIVYSQVFRNNSNGGSGEFYITGAFGPSYTPLGYGSYYSMSGYYNSLLAKIDPDTGSIIYGFGPDIFSNPYYAPSTAITSLTIPPTTNDRSLYAVFGAEFASIFSVTFLSGQLVMPADGGTVIAKLLDENVCSVDSCVRGGQCVSAFGSYSCLGCPMGYQTDDCRFRSAPGCNCSVCYTLLTTPSVSSLLPFSCDPCAGEPCLNGGTCVPDLGEPDGYYCNCPVPDIAYGLSVSQSNCAMTFCPCIQPNTQSTIPIDDGMNCICECGIEWTGQICSYPNLK